MQCYKFFTQDAELAEEILVGCQGNSGKVDLQKISVALPVCRRVEDGVDIVEDVLWTEGGDKVAMAIRYELEARWFSRSNDEILGSRLGMRPFFATVAKLKYQELFFLFEPFQHYSKYKVEIPDSLLW